jgi:hypothetical protein
MDAGNVHRARARLCIRHAFSTQKRHHTLNRVPPGAESPSVVADAPAANGDSTPGAYPLHTKECSMQTDKILAGWLSGADSVGGYDNPAGSLYTEGQTQTMAAMVNAEMALASNCSSCTASRPGLCC